MAAWRRARFSAPEVGLVRDVQAKIVATGVDGEGGIVEAARREGGFLVAGAGRGIQNRQQGGSRDADLGVGLLNAGNRGCDIEVLRLRLSLELVELRRTEAAPPVLRGPCGCRGLIGGAEPGGNVEGGLVVVGAEIAAGEQTGQGREAECRGTGVHGQGISWRCVTGVLRQRASRRAGGCVGQRVTLHP